MRVTRRILFLGLVLVMIAGLLPAVSGSPVGAAQGAVGWRELRDRPSDLYATTCFDTTRANTVIFNVLGASTDILDWTTGQGQFLNRHTNAVCGADGWIYSTTVGGTGQGPGDPWRFSVADPAGQALAHYPTHLAHDGSGWVYALEVVGGRLPVHPAHRLWASSDSGLTWAERGQQFNQNMEGLMVAESDGRVLYGVVVDRSQASQAGWALWRSADGGASWEQRFSGSGPAAFAGSLVRLEAPAGAGAPVDTLVLRTDGGLTGQDVGMQVYVSRDGARSFTAAGTDVANAETRIVWTPQGLLRVDNALNPTPGTGLARSSDGGLTWQPLAQPPPGPGAAPRFILLRVAPFAPQNVFLSSSSGLWYSPDSGTTWRQIAPSGVIDAISGYLPLQVVRRDGDQQFVAEIPFSDRSQAAPVLATGAPGSRYFAETGHNLPAVFREYWEAHGGLAQFGYPRTEPVPEVNLTDGRIYLAQYYERNRFEYHPEFAGTPNAVLLGLLGNQLTTARRAAGEAPFLRVEGPGAPDVTYFPQTGHTLRGPFGAYWAQHGGLALYGFPISEEFSEVNPDDGQTYTVQYFERNRFEYHPEFAGTPYDVLLGLLGNTLIRQKGWD
jgi:hypothetical protein